MLPGQGLTLQTCSLLGIPWMPVGGPVLTACAASPLSPPGPLSPGRSPEENLEALEEFRKFTQRKGLSAQDIVTPEQTGEGRLPVGPACALGAPCATLSSGSLLPRVSLSFCDPNVPCIPNISLRPYVPFCPHAPAPPGTPGPAWVLVTGGLGSGRGGAWPCPGAVSPPSFPWFLQTPVSPSTTRVSDHGRTQSSQSPRLCSCRPLFSASSRPPKQGDPGWPGRGDPLGYWT